MSDLIPLLIPLLLTDIINPVLMAAVIYALGSRRSYLNSSCVLLGWFGVYLLTGVILAIGLEAITEFLANPRPVDFVIEVGLGCLLIWLGWRLVRAGDNKRGKQDFEDADALNPFKALVLGGSINLIGLPFAIPYFAVLDQILKADLDVVSSLVALVIYNLLYLLPFLALILVRLVMGQGGDAVLAKVNYGMDRAAAVIMPVLLFVLGGALIADAAVYFSKGKPLF